MHELDIPLQMNNLEGSFGCFIEMAAIQCDYYVTENVLLLTKTLSVLH